MTDPTGIFLAFAAVTAAVGIGHYIHRARNTLREIDNLFHRSRLIDALDRAEAEARFHV